MSATAVLLADNLKQPGRLTIQLRGDGPISLLVIDCNQALNVRCMAQHGKDIDNDAHASDIDLLGQGQLLLSLDTPAMHEPYQSIVPLTGNNIAEIFEHYLKQSEQLASRFFLAAGPSGIAGLFLQKCRRPTSATATAGHAWKPWPARLPAMNCSICQPSVFSPGCFTRKTSVCSRRRR